MLLEPDGAARARTPGTLFIDCSTIGPAATREIGAGAGRARADLIDAPVTGSSPGPQDGTLTFMVGGADEDFERARPLLEAMGKLIVHAGPLGQGQMVKLINNAVAATNAAVVGEALLVGAKAGVDLDALVAVMAAGPGGSAMLTLKAGADARSRLQHAVQARAHAQGRPAVPRGGPGRGAPFPSGRYAREILAAAMGRGHADDDFAAMIEAARGRRRCRGCKRPASQA